MYILDGITQGLEWLQRLYASFCGYKTVEVYKSLNVQVTGTHTVNVHFLY